MHATPRAPAARSRSPPLVAHAKGDNKSWSNHKVEVSITTPVYTTPANLNCSVDFKPRAIAGPAPPPRPVWSPTAADMPIKLVTGPPPASPRPADTGPALLEAAAAGPAEPGMPPAIVDDRNGEADAGPAADNSGAVLAQDAADNPGAVLAQDAADDHQDPGLSE